jgi:hypothetical protein
LFVSLHSDAFPYPTSGTLTSERGLVVVGVVLAYRAVGEIDDQELPLAEFSTLLRTYADWGMRLCLAPAARLMD